jgi:hypothetical protein
LYWSYRVSLGGKVAIAVAVAPPGVCVLAAVLVATVVTVAVAATLVDVLVAVGGVPVTVAVGVPPPAVQPGNLNEPMRVVQSPSLVLA